MADMDYSKESPFSFREGAWLNSKGDVESLSVGQSTMPRGSLASSTVSATSGDLRLSYFTSIKSEAVTQIRTVSGGTAGVTPTLCRVGLYSVGIDGTLTLEAAVANDTTLWTAANTRYTRTLNQSYTLVRGTRYAIGILCVSASTPTMVGVNVNTAGENGEEPRLAGNFSGQTDLPSTIAPGSLATPASRTYAVILP